MIHEGPFPAHPYIQLPVGSVLTWSSFFIHRAWQLYRTESLHLPGHPVSAVTFRRNALHYTQFTPNFHLWTIPSAAASTSLSSTFPYFLGLRAQYFTVLRHTGWDTKFNTPPPKKDLKLDRCICSYSAHQTPDGKKKNLGRKVIKLSQVYFSLYLEVNSFFVCYCRLQIYERCESPSRSSRPLNIKVLYSFEASVADYAATWRCLYCLGHTFQRYSSNP